MPKPQAEQLHAQIDHIKVSNSRKTNTLFPLWFYG